MIKVLHNSRSDLYLNLKKEILGKNFPWFYQEKTTSKNVKYDGHKNVSIFDLGPYNEQSVDYPDFAKKLAKPSLL